MKRSVPLSSLVLTGVGVSLISGLSVEAGEVSFKAPQELSLPGFGELEGPELVDFDGDGVLDLLSGNYEGNVIFRKNSGSNAAPVWSEPVKLQRGGKTIELRHW